MIPVDLADVAAADWRRLVKGFADAGALLVTGDAERPPAYAMCERMLVRAAREGAGALAWAARPLDVVKLAAGSGGRARRRFAELAELATAPADVPVAFAQIQRAFADDEDRAPALVAMFLEAGRRAEALVEQLELAGQADRVLGEAARTLARALPRARLRPFKPRVRTLADFDRVRATGYVDGTPGRIAEVRRAGLAWNGNVLRKADVIVFERAP